ncbi:hypothetical protein DOY81_003497 [Sarcophaga bullata]|nr:hypothetical protein DOY81_003497 [Sarcophaga bullata]
MSFICGECKNSLPATEEYVKCLYCEKNYHYSPCTAITKEKYDDMDKKCKSEWKCHNCSKNITAIVPLENNPQTIQSDEDDDDDDELIKSYDCLEDLDEIQTNMLSLALGINNKNDGLKEVTKPKPSKVTYTITDPMEELIFDVNKRMQNAIRKKVVINNVPKHVNEAYEAIQKIADFLEIPLEKKDILKGEEISEGNENDSQENIMYIQDELTSHSKHLLALAKARAKECNWKYVWKFTMIYKR